MQKFWKTAFVGLAAVSALLGGPARAAGEAWPAKPITFVVPFTPGGITDNTSRVLAKIVGDKLGQPVVVDNRPGAGGSIGVEAASRQAPDGYTMIYGTQGTQAANLALYKNIRYDPVKDFVPVHAMSETPLILVINPNRPFKTVPELIAYAKANPGKLNFGSAGPGTGTHLTAELFQVATGIKMTHVPYKGSSPALTDLMAGNLDLMFDYPVVVMPFVQAGKLKPLAMTGRARLSVMPEVPTVGELGFPRAESSAWSAVFVPAKTPPEVVKKLGDAIALAIVDPEMLQVTEKFGSVPLKDLRDAKLGEFVKTEMVRWREVVQQSGARID
ncbi:ABC transporter substrate-binding protein [Variovorax paradoxus]|jgi:tripartite-type tricarboxylate transporter receptor subunit TctC|uniref:Bug family tripartite tricarboxylate transporter substrate binding protein n=1 Tax=Variovorax TaxID=34072 RepID=UPI0006E64A5A|nr:tripartite tricarboxylate transporter substrate binding protein [Variovorax sp. CY25R-8]KPU97749.1 ABC transporter substrate-binding protein [Variovorax paradoxus]KPV06421.1 ABC transporter substrate-binding protein [Variovorax paradoxus]KPV10732.1 ABC transporter substrate-binding protein [Variovorax paradoxus]KPV22833.1 ABC transporter substrate-binding protein [Variovorax paradoxus]KPV33299.1 ABC transporter substrate-binding protein [Variovorax paradoxus]